MESPAVHPGYLISAISRTVAWATLLLVFLQQDRLDYHRFIQKYYHRHERTPTARELFRASISVTTVQYIFHICGTAICFLSVILSIDADGAFGVYYFPALVFIRTNNSMLIGFTFLGYIFIASKTLQAASMGQRRYKYTEIHLRNTLFFCVIFVNVFAVLGVVTGIQSFIAANGILGVTFMICIPLWHMVTTYRLVQLMNAANKSVQSSKQLDIDKSLKKWTRLSKMLIVFVPLAVTWIVITTIVDPLRGRHKYLRTDKAQTYDDFDWASTSGTILSFVYTSILLKHSWITVDWKETTTFTTSQTSKNVQTKSKENQDCDGNLSSCETDITRV